MKTRHNEPSRVKLGLNMLLLILVFVPPAAYSDPLQQDRRINWTYAGVPGSIPNRTTICTTLSPGTTSSAINSALKSCSDGVVKLNPGTYNITGISIPSNVTLRGSGADQTILKGCNIISMKGSNAAKDGRTITGGGAKDSRTIVVGSTSGLAVGTQIEIDRDNESFVVSTIGGTRHITQVNVITAISGTTITLRNPLIWDFKTGNPKIKFIYAGQVRNSGVEDLKLDHTGTSGCTNFPIHYTDSTWLKGIESYMASGYHIQLLGTVNFEIRDSYIHEAQTFGRDNGGLQVYGSFTYGANSSMKIENNIFNKLFPAVELQNSSSGFVVGYNYSYGSASQASGAPVTWTMMDNHGPHNMMNLFEGNIAELYGSDGYFGGSSHGTAFRNYFDGVNHNSGNVDSPIRLHRLSYNYNLIGNVLGSSTLKPSKYVQTADNCTGGFGIYMFGYPNIGNCGLTDVTGNPVPGGMNYPDAKVSSTLLRWGNYDYFNKATQWASSEIPSGVTVPTDQIIPSSYYYSSRPSWWTAGVPWPAIGPDVTGGNGDVSGHVNKIPALLCWEKRSLVGSGTFNASSCYVASATVLSPPSSLRVIP